MTAWRRCWSSPAHWRILGHYDRPSLLRRDRWLPATVDLAELWRKYAAGIKRTKARLATRKRAHQKFPGHNREMGVAEPHVVSALRAKNAELAGEIEATERCLHELWRALEHVAGSLMLFEPDAKLESIRPKSFRRQADWAQRGEHARRVLHVLRRANGEPLTTRAITLQVMAERGSDVGRPKLIREMTRRLSYTLRSQRDKGTPSAAMERGWPGGCGSI